MWSRLDWKRGRFNVNSETTFIHRGLRGWQRGWGDSITYWRYEDDLSAENMHPVYDEATGAGKVFYGAWQIPVLHVNHNEATDTEPRDAGLYVTDSLEVVCEFDQLMRIGLSEVDLKHGVFQRDRITYDNLVFGVRHVDIQGQMRRRDVIVTISATQLMNDEIVNDPQFKDYLDDVNFDNSFTKSTFTKPASSMPKGPTHGASYHDQGTWH
jgi:hypothetical protein